MKFVNSNFYNQTQVKPIFRGNKNGWHVFGIDEGGKSAREYIRQWHYEYYMPYQSIYENESRKSEYEQKNIISYFTKKTVVDSNKLNKIGLYNLEKLGSTNSYRGAMVKGYETHKLSMLKDAGIKSIASFMYDTELEEACKQYNMDYLYFNMDTKNPCMQTKEEILQKSENFWKNIAKVKEKSLLESYIKRDFDKWNKESQASIEEFIKFIKFMQKDNVYIGCACGTNRTDFGVMLDLLFNPSANFDCHNIYNSFDNLKAFENLYHNLTRDNKLKMGWTKSFEEAFLSRLGKYKM